VIGEFEANGVVGLAPSGGKESIIEQLKASGMIKNKIIGLNYENPLDNNQKSVITLGNVNYDEVDGGQDGLNFYSNLAIGKWGLLMDDFMYNGVDMTGDHHAHIALVDSGNFSIQIPETMFKNLLNTM
jgi:hypothetical protein